MFGPGIPPRGARIRLPFVRALGGPIVVVHSGALRPAALAGLPVPDSFPRRGPAFPSPTVRTSIPDWGIHAFVRLKWMRVGGTPKI